MADCRRCVFDAGNAPPKIRGLGSAVYGVLFFIASWKEPKIVSFNGASTIKTPYFSTALSRDSSLSSSSSKRALAFSIFPWFR